MSDFNRPTPPRTPSFSAVLETALRQAASPQQVARRRGRRRIARALVLATVVAATAVVVLGPLRGGEDGGGVARAQSILLIDGTVVPLDDLADPRIAAHVREQLASNGVQLLVNRKPVGAQAAGKAIDVEYPAGATVDNRNRLRITLQLRGPIIVTIGYAATQADRDRAGAHGVDYETPRQICDLVDPQNPDLTLRRLRDHDYSVTLSLVRFERDPKTGTPTTTKTVKEPPPDTIVLSVLDENGALVHADTRAIMLELRAADDPGGSGEPAGQGLFCEK